MPYQSSTWVRRYAAGFAIILGLQAAWILAAELLRPAVPYFPADIIQAGVTAKQHSSAAVAAWVGWPRGDLWTDYAVTANASDIGKIEDDTSKSYLNSRATSITETAAALAPYDARAWLILAADNAQSAANIDKTLAQLKISYYTSPYNVDLFPLRIQLAARSPGITDAELGSFVEYEIGMVVRHKPSLKKYLAAAYHAASPEGALFIETTLAKLDPQYLSELKPSTR